MVEVTKDDGEIAEEFNYDQEEFDEYEDEDFDSSSNSGSSDDREHVKPPPSVPTESDRLDLMQVSSIKFIFIEYIIDSEGVSVCYYVVLHGLVAKFSDRGKFGYLTIDILYC